MSNFKFNCPHCQQSIEAPPKMMGTAADCPSCNKSLCIPTIANIKQPPSTPAPPPPSPPNFNKTQPQPDGDKRKKIKLIAFVSIVLIIVIFIISWMIGLSQRSDFTIPGLGMKFVYVAPDSFLMGSHGIDNERPVHNVTISKGYWIGKYEVTQSEYQSIIGNNPSKFKGRNKPVENVSWNDAVNFCEKLTARERAAGRLPSGCEYRLPTEAEWEFAARGGIKNRGHKATVSGNLRIIIVVPEIIKYSGSDNIDSVAWYDLNSGKKTHEVGTKSPNELGIHDMSGNVVEWCLDDWCYGYTGAPSDGGPRDSNDRTGLYQARRGGSWGDEANCCRSAFRRGYTPSGRYDYLGFRLVRTTPVKSER